MSIGVFHGDLRARSGSETGFILPMGVLILKNRWKIFGFLWRVHWWWWWWYTMYGPRTKDQGPKSVLMQSPNKHKQIEQNLRFFLCYFFTDCQIVMQG
jgi:hypothetical protein